MSIIFQTPIGGKVTGCPYAPQQVASDDAVRPEPLSAEQVRRRLLVPAVGILVSVLINVGWLAWYLVTLLWALIAGASIPIDVALWACVTVLVTGLVNYAAAGGAVAMLQLTDYRTAMRGAWFALVPCGVGCFLALPFAIWADWLLRDPRVHAVFSGEKRTFLWLGKG
jgi:hypothetical protein